MAATILHRFPMPMVRYADLVPEGYHVVGGLGEIRTHDLFHAMEAPGVTWQSHRTIPERWSVPDLVD